jgi:ABC-type ATPase involved in cell division
MGDTSGAGVSIGAQVTVRGLTRSFHSGGEVTAVDDLSLDIAPGSVVGVTGPSGSGKSTLLHLIGGIERADTGSITVDGQDITALRRRRLAEYRRGVGFVFQRYHLLAALTALDNVIAPVLPYRVGFDRAARARELLDAVGLADRERAPAGGPVRRPAAAGGDRPRAHYVAAAAAGRRADRQPRLQDRLADPRPAAAPAGRARHDDRARHARAAHRGTL